MGQYYNAVLKINGGKEVFSTYVDGEFVGCKLMEHSYWGNSFVLAIASKFWRTKGQLAWVGDYADEDDFNWNTEFEDVYSNIARADLSYNGFRLEGKYLINHTKKIFIDLDEYKNLLKKEDWIINPLSLLTAVGNGKGGGDFGNEQVGAKMVGSWTWDIIEITDQDLYDWKYNMQTKSYDAILKEAFNDYKNVTGTFYFIEK